MNLKIPQCPACKSGIRIDSRFCSNCGVKIDPSLFQQEKNESKYAERKQLTVLFSDLAGSTRMSDILDPEDMRDILREYQTVCSNIIKSYDGFVAKFLGDGILAYFGYPEAHEDDAGRSVRAGLSIIEAMKSYSEKFIKQFGVRTDVRIGIHTGLVVVGDMGGSQFLEADAIVGKTPNLAARIQTTAELNTVYISESTKKLLGVFFECENLGSHDLKGISKPVNLYQVLHERTGASRFEVLSDKLTPFTGRKEEIRQLQEGWAKAEEGKGQVFIINGEAGIGKSRIVHYMKEFNANQKNSWLTEIRCSQYFSNSSLYPIIDMMERVVLGYSQDESPEGKLLKLEGWSSQYGTNEEIVPLFAPLLSIPLSEKYSPSNLTPVKLKEKTIDLLISILLKRSETQPVLFIVEDLHWADPSTLELLSKFIDRCTESHILAIFTHRPQFTHDWGDYPSVSVINLNRLKSKESKEVVNKITGGKYIPENAIEYILDKTDGIPLFLEELTAMMLEEEMFTESDGKYKLSSPLATLPVPNTLNDLLFTKLDRMKEAKAVAQLAAAIGREFSFSMLQNIPGEHHKDLKSNLDKLVDSGLLYQKIGHSDTLYVFKHALIRDSAYSSLLKSSRRTIHRIIADSFVKHRSDIVEAQPELIAYHYSKSHSPLEAMSYWQKAGEFAIHRSAMPEAISHLTEAIEESTFLPEGPEKLGGELMAQTYLGLANMQAWGYGHPDVETAFTRARDLCKLMGDPPQIFPVLHGLVKFKLVRGEYETGLNLGKQLQKTAEETKDDNLLIEALYVVGAAQFWMGDTVKSMTNLTQLVDLYTYEDHKHHASIYGEDPCVTALSHNLWQKAVCGRYAQSLEDLNKAESLVDHLQHPWSTDYFLTCKTHLFSVVHDYEKTENAAVEFLKSATEHGFPWWVANANINLGWAMAHRGKRKKGLELAVENVKLWRMMGAELATTNFYLKIGEIHLLDSNYENALNAINEALNICYTTREGLYEAEIHRVKGIALARQNKVDEAFLEFEIAIKLATKRNHNLWLLKSTMSHIRLCAKHDHPQKHLSLLKDTLNKFDYTHGQRDIVQANKLISSI